MTNFFSNITEATLWFEIFVIMIILYLALGRFPKIIPTIFHVKEIIIGYAKVFPNIWDLVYMLILVTITTRITTLKVPINISQEYTQIGVILTLLRRWTKGYTIKQPNMDCQPTEITALMRHRAVFS